MTENSSSKMVMAAPAALFILGCVSFGLFALLTRQVPGTAIRTLNAFTMAAGAGIIIASVIELIRNNMVFGTVILVSGSLMVLGTGWAFMISSGTDSFIGNVLPADLWERGLQMAGWVWLGIGIVQIFLLPVAAKVSWSLIVSVLINAVSAFMLALGLMQRIGFGDGIVNTAGFVFLIGGIFSMYIAMGFLTNAAWGKRIFPV